MKKIIITSIILAIWFTLVSCTNPFSSNNNADNRWFRWMWRWQIDWGRGRTDDIVRLKWRWWREWWQMNPRFQRFGSWARMWSWSFNERFSKLSEEDRNKLKESMDARRSWDTAKSDQIMSELKNKYPDVFSGSITFWSNRLRKENSNSWTTLNNSWTINK